MRAELRPAGLPPSPHLRLDPGPARLPRPCRRPECLQVGPQHERRGPD